LAEAVKQAVGDTPLYAQPLAEAKSKLTAAFNAALQEDQVVKAERRAGYYFDGRARERLEQAVLFRADKLAPEELKTIVETHRAANPDLLEIKAADIVDYSMKGTVRQWLEAQVGQPMPLWARVAAGEMTEQEFEAQDHAFRDAIDAKRLTWQQLDIEVPQGLELALRPAPLFLSTSLSRHLEQPPALDAWRGLGLVVERRLARTLQESYANRFQELVALKSERARVEAEHNAQEAQAKRQQQADIEWAPYYDPAPLAPALTALEPFEIEAYLSKSRPQAVAAAQEIIDKLGSPPHRLAPAERSQRLHEALASLGTDILDKPRFPFSTEHKYKLPYELTAALNSQFEPEFLFDRERDQTAVERYALEALIADPRLLKISSADLYFGDGRPALETWLGKQLGHPAPNRADFSDDESGQAFAAARQEFFAAIDSADLEWKQLYIDDPWAVMQQLSSRRELSRLTAADVVARVGARRQGRELSGLLHERSKQLTEERVQAEQAERTQRYETADRERRAEVAKEWSEVAAPSAPSVQPDSSDLGL
jgi:hypothetical protein